MMVMMMMVILVMVIVIVVITLKGVLSLCGHLWPTMHVHMSVLQYENHM